MRSILGYALLLTLAAAAATAFSQPRVARQARGGESDIKVPAGAGKVESLPEATRSTGSSSESKAPDALLATLFGGVVGLVMAASEAVQHAFKQKFEEPWSPKKEIGATRPLEFFDPLDLAEDEEKFRKYRTAEIKHGRVAMMAAAGAVAQHFVKLPGFKGAPAGVEALQTTQGQIGAGLLFVACGYLETKVWKEDASKEPGNFGDPAGWSTTGLGGGSYSKAMRERELNNGRFAMFAAVGIIAAELLSGKDAVQQLTPWK